HRGTAEGLSAPRAGPAAQPRRGGQEHRRSPHNRSDERSYVQCRGEIDTMAKVLGIDLGTTNSCMAVMDGGEPVVVPNAEGGRTTPSVVAFAKSGERLVGQAAKRQAVVNPKNTVYSIKRFMGRKYEEVEQERKRMPYDVVRASNGDAAVKVLVGGEEKTFTPPEISAMILQKMKADAEAYLGEKIEKAVVT